MNDFFSDLYDTGKIKYIIIVCAILSLIIGFVYRAKSIDLCRQLCKCKYNTEYFSSGIYSCDCQMVKNETFHDFEIKNETFQDFEINITK